MYIRASNETTCGIGYHGTVFQWQPEMILLIN